METRILLRYLQNVLLLEACYPLQSLRTSLKPTPEKEGRVRWRENSGTRAGRRTKEHEEKMKEFEVECIVDFRDTGLEVGKDVLGYKVKWMVNLLPLKPGLLVGTQRSGFDDILVTFRNE